MSDSVHNKSIPLRRSALPLITSPENFYWATGIEDTFITEPWPGTDRILDEYSLTGHYDQWQQDFELMASLGVNSIRYGIPWHKVNPRCGVWDWSWADSSLERLIELKIQPIIDLVHYGVPSWIEGSFTAPSYPERVSEYAARLAERFRGRVYAYTPLNEPRITAWYCGRLGWWPPYLKGWRGFVRVLLQICRGILLTCHQLTSADKEIVTVHVDSNELYFSDDPQLAAEVEFRQQLGFLSFDLVSGRVMEHHPLWSWLVRYGATERDLSWFLEQPAPLDIVGINFYPMFSSKQLVRSHGSLRGRMPYATPNVLPKLMRLTWERYKRPIMITETASRRSINRRRTWLYDSVAAVRQVRNQGIPVIGYTWWPMIGLVGWAYRQGSKPIDYYVERMGLWDMDFSSPDKVKRVHTPVVDAYREIIEAGDEAVGRLKI